MAILPLNLTRLALLCGLLVGTAFSSASCRSPTSPSPFEVDGLPSRTLAVVVGQEIRVEVANIGPGAYVSPPTISSSAVRFLDVSLCCTNPGGVDQVFRFVAAAPGLVTVAFQNTWPSLDPEIDDTMIVW